MSTDREHTLTQAFVSIANSLVDGVDVVDLLSGLTTDWARLLDVASAGLLLADGHGVLHVLAASSERTRDLEMFQLQREQGPCLDCYRIGVPVEVDDLAAQAERWPQFVPAALDAGFASVHAVPLRLHETVLGALNLFGNQVGPLRPDDLDLAQALAHVASIALVADRAASDKETINQQLQTALTSRIPIEQAKGILSQRGNLDMERSFAVLRRYSRDHNERLSAVAKHVVSRELPAAQLLEHARTKVGSPRRTGPGS
jgi:transcriptional regulator with GAF, ATPase, and Fis domain